MSKFCPSPSPLVLLFLTVGILCGVFSPRNVSGFPSNGIGTGSSGTSSSKLAVPRVGINRSGKDNGRAEYATHRPYKVDFDLLRVSDRSQELEMPQLRTNVLDGSQDPDYYFLASDPTLRSRRRRRRQVVQHMQPSSNMQQGVSLCLPYLNTNPMCQQQMVFGFGLPSSVSTNNNVALAVPTTASAAAILIPSGISSPSSALSTGSSYPPSPFFGSLSRNDLAVLNYYQQQPQPLPPQATIQQPVQSFQGPVPDERQRQQYENIHNTYPYPYYPPDPSVKNPNPPPSQEQPQPGQPQQQPPPLNPNQPGVPPPVGPEGVGEITTDYPSEMSGTTLLPMEEEELPPQNNQQVDQSVTPGRFPNSPSVQQQQQPPVSYPSGGVISSVSSESSSSSAPPQFGVPSSPSSEIHGDEYNGQSVVNGPQQQQQIQQLNQAVKRQLLEKEEENRQLRAQLEQANLQIVSYEQENAHYKEYKDQYVRAEEANVKLRDRVLQLENTNQHLQEQNGQLQQVNAEQRQQINSLKDSQRELLTQVEDYQSKMAPLYKDIQKHKKEIEEFLIRIRKMGEENETCRKQLKLYQLKVNYIMEQQKRQELISSSSNVAPPGKPSPFMPHKQPGNKTPVVVHHDDEQDPELARMDAEIAALQKNADELASAIKSLPQPPQSVTATEDNGAAAPAIVSPILEQKQEKEFPGEAVQVNPEQTQKHPPASEVPRAPSASRNFPTWEKPAGF